MAGPLRGPLFFFGRAGNARVVHHPGDRGTGSTGDTRRDVNQNPDRHCDPDPDAYPYADANPDSNPHRDSYGIAEPNARRRADLEQ
jgi:hypothetical protein